MLGITFGLPEQWPHQDLIGFSEEFSAGLALEAYRCGVFPMPLDPDAEMGWWSPMERGLLPVGRLRVTRSLRKMAKRYTTTVDRAFDQVLERCADPNRPDGWIDGRIGEAYRTLHETGWAHSIEVWDDQQRLVGGLYGLSIGGLFAGESMFHDPQYGRDASKIAVARLTVELRELGTVLLDVQWLTPHLASLGGFEVSRETYLAALDQALELPDATWPSSPPRSGQAVLETLANMVENDSKSTLVQ